MLKSANYRSTLTMAAAEAAADRPWSNDSKGSSCVMRDERMERGAPMSAAVVEGTDADDTKSRERIRCPRRWTDGGK